MNHNRWHPTKVRRFLPLALSIIFGVTAMATGCRDASMDAVAQTLTTAAQTAQGSPSGQVFTLAAPADSPASVPGQVTSIRLSRTPDGGDCNRAPVTFGQAFVKGDLSQGQTLHAQYEQQTLPTQVDVKARNDDGSARHGVITIQAPCDVGRQGASVALVAAGRNTGSKSLKTAVSLTDILDTEFDSRITIKTKGEQWRLDARELLEKVRRAGGCEHVDTFCERRLDGSLVSGWVVGGPLKRKNGQAHPHLAAYFALRAYGPPPVSRIRVDVVVENDWAYQSRPKNIKYKPVIRVAGHSAYSPGQLTHYRQARWHHVAWWGESDDAPLYAASNPAYLQATRAAPQYQNVDLSQKMMSKVRQQCPPMRHCDQTKHMGAGGAQAAIGPLPRWSSAFVINPNYRLYRWMLANTDAMGAYGMHYRQRDTGRPLSVRDHPCATIAGPGKESTCPAAPHGDDRFPECRGHCDSPLKANLAHHPAPAYMAYLSTGDWYYETEMVFWADWVIFWQNPKYRDYKKGLVHNNQLRAQAWMLRTLGDAAYLLPDDSPKKDYFNQVVANNIAWYNERYTNNPKANKLGANEAHYAVGYPIQGHPRTGIAPWQQSFFTWAVGNLVDQRYRNAKAFLNWTSQFQVGQMTSPGYCWELASAYKVRIRDTRDSPFYDSFAQVYAKTYPELSKLGCEAAQLNAAIRRLKISKHFDYSPKTMVGFPKSGTGYPANFQIGLAAAARSDLPQAVDAWNKFVHRSVLPDYTRSPQFAIVPRKPVSR